MLSLRSLFAAVLFAPLAHAQCASDVFGALDGSTVGYFLRYDGQQVIAPQPALGRLLIFERSGSSWSESQQLLPSVPGGEAGLGIGIDLEGDRLVVGAPYESQQAQYAGAVYVFERSSQGLWSETARILPPNPSASLYFGWQVSLSGDRIAVSQGANFYNDDEGVYLYELVGGAWQVEDFVLGSDSLKDDAFGCSVALDGETLLVGARHNDALFWQGGAAYVFENSPGGWTETARLTGSLTNNFDQFGISVALQGDRAIVGAHHEDEVGPNAGAAYLFERSSGLWSQTARLEAPHAQAWATFGARVQLEGDRVSVSQSLVRPPVVFDLQGGEWIYRSAFTRIPELLNNPSAALWQDEVMLGSTEQGISTTGAIRAFELSSDVQPYCLCADRAWCPDPMGGCDTSRAEGARIEACGSTSVQLDELVVTAHNLPENQFGLLFMGAGEARVAFGDGERCVAPGGVGLFRFPVRSSGGVGQFSEGPGLVQQTAALFGPAGTITAGSTWYLQAWFRDPQGPICPERVLQTVPRGFNLSNALRIAFRP